MDQMCNLLLSQSSFFDVDILKLHYLSVLSFFNVSQGVNLLSATKLGSHIAPSLLLNKDKVVSRNGKNLISLVALNVY